MAARTNYAQLVAQAEQAVAGVKDAELRRVAFQKILEELLSSGSASSRGARKRGGVKDQAGELQAKGKSGKRGTQANLDELVHEGFFRKQKTIAQVKAELENRGHHIPITSLSGPLQRLCQRRLLRRQRIKTSGKRETFAYSDW